MEAAQQQEPPQAAPQSAPDLETIPEEQLLDLRIRDLPLRIPGTWLEACVEQLYRELKARNIMFEPRCYLADEWLTPEGEPVIGIPFYLAHPRLMALEKKMMLEAEGDTPEWCMKLLRHEAGHALTYAFGLNRKRSWQRVFGSSKEEYGETYRFRPYSKSFVRHLDNYYAQYHPDEDFVETFAVWLTPGLDWRSKYKGWKALEKLEFVDKLMSEIAWQPPVKKKGKQYWGANRIRSTLRRHYKQRRESQAEDQPDFHDANLRRLFSVAQEKSESRPPVAKLVQAYRRQLLATVSDWTGESRYMTNEVLSAVQQRCKLLKLVSNDAEPVAVLKLSTYLTTLLMNYRHTNRLRGKGLRL